MTGRKWHESRGISLALFFVERESARIHPLRSNMRGCRAILRPEGYFHPYPVFFLALASIERMESGH